MKRLFSLCLLILPLISFAQAQFSNVIIFGDSLSDGGNVPENPHVLSHPNQPETLHNLAQDFYVPITNPVNPNDFKVSLVKQFHLSGHAPYAWPNLTSRADLPAQPEVQGQAREFRSQNWPYFLLSDGYQDGMTASRSLLPWAVMMHDGLKAGINTSVDYAWASALSTTQCVNIDYDVKSRCDRASIMNAYTNYLNDRTDANHDDLHIPGALEQVNLFVQDVQNQTVTVGPNTAYTLWVGGNDMAKAADEFRQTKNLIKKAKLISALTFQVTWNNYQALNTLLSHSNIQAKHIYLFTLFDTAKVAPGMHDWPAFMKDADHFEAWAFNHALHMVVSLLQHKYPSASVNIVPTYDWYNQMADDTGPYAGVFDPKNLGLACQLSASSYSGPNGGNNCKGYIFWNQLHPSTPANQFVGYQLEQLMSTTWAAKAANQQAANLPTSTADQKAWLKAQITQMVKAKLHV